MNNNTWRTDDVGVAAFVMVVGELGLQEIVRSQSGKMYLYSFSDPENHGSAMKRRYLAGDPVCARDYDSVRRLLLRSLHEARHNEESK